MLALASIGGLDVGVDGVGNGQVGSACLVLIKGTPAARRARSALPSRAMDRQSGALDRRWSRRSGWGREGGWPLGGGSVAAASVLGRTVRVTAAAPFSRTRRQSVPAAAHPLTAPA